MPKRSDREDENSERYRVSLSHTHGWCVQGHGPTPIVAGANARRAFTKSGGDLASEVIDARLECATVDGTYEEVK